METSAYPSLLARRASRSLPVEYFVLANFEFEGPVIGRLAGRPIRETVVDTAGNRYRYAGLARRDQDGRYDSSSQANGSSSRG